MDFITFDTETEDGKAFLACVDDGKKFSDHLINNKEDVVAFFHHLHSHCIKKESSKKHKENLRRLGFCYNLEYDVSALLKYFGNTVIIDLYLNKSLYYDNMFIRSVPNIFLIITKYYHNKTELSSENILKLLSDWGLYDEKEDGILVPDQIVHRIEKYNQRADRKDKIKKKDFHFFDMWQFYHLPLDKASEKFLGGEAKVSLPQSWLSNMKKKFNNPKHKNKIIKRCQIDSRLTHKLADKFIGMLADCDIRPRFFYSFANIARNYFNKNVDVPIINEDYDNGKGKEILKFMQGFCRSGRTEAFKRGTFEKGYLSDINSAYGYALANLKRITHAELSTRIHPSADYYFIDCEIELHKSYINPVPVKFNMWKYPYGKFRATIDNRTRDNIIKAGGLITKIYRVLNVYCNDEYPFKKIIKRMFAQRQKSESHNYVFKHIIVSYVGKLHEQKRFKRLLSEKEKIEILQQTDQWGKKQDDFESLIKHNCPECYAVGAVQNSCRNEVCIEYRKEYKGVEEPPDIYRQGENVFATEKKLGNGTNIIYAGLVTSTIRNVIYEEGVKLGDDLIAFLTDGIFSKRPIKKYGKGLGEFSLKYKGPLYLLGSGMYQMADTITESGRKQINVKFRGFNSEKVNLKELSNKFRRSKVMKIPTLERTGIGRAIKDVQNFKNFNTLNPSKKKLNVNFDTNRIWEKPFKNYQEALKTHINSVPVGI